VGMPTHVAARMEQLATPGSIVITAETLACVEHLIDVRPLGRVVVKGLAEGVQAYEVLPSPADAPPTAHLIDAPGIPGHSSASNRCRCIV